VGLREMSDLLYEIKEQADCCQKLGTKIGEDTNQNIYRKEHLNSMERI